MARQAMGTCTRCGNENCTVTAVDPDTRLCEACLDALDYIQCDHCHDFFIWDSIPFYNLKDRRVLCVHCAKALLKAGKLRRQDIDAVLDYT